MNVLLTGAFGNIGTNALTELLKQGHRVRCFDLKTKNNERAARRLAGRPDVEVVWGDLRRPEDVHPAVQGQDVVVHLAFIVPKLSATGVESEKRPDWAEAINVGGTQNVIDAARAQAMPPRLVFASSLHVYGHTQHLLPPRTAADPVRPVEHYARHKVECEQRVRDSGLSWTILRFAAAMPIAIKLDPGMFDVPLDNRIEFAHTRDVGLAVANAVGSREVWGKLLLIGGGPRCQYYYREIVERVLEAAGVGMLPDAAFSTTPFATDWLDTAESQRLLCYQQRDLGDYVREMIAVLGPRRALIQAFRPLARYALVRLSPYFPWPRNWMWQRRRAVQTI
jgi:nucleoside-diphosphate-sugar epimerase